MYDKTNRLGREIILRIDFHKRNRELVKTTSSKYKDTLVAPEDDLMLNDIYPTDLLLNVRLGARPQVPCQATTA